MSTIGQIPGLQIMKLAMLNSPFADENKQMQIYHVLVLIFTVLNLAAPRSHR